MKKGKNKKTEKEEPKERKETISTGVGKFNFPNGDSYEGEYIVLNNEEIYRHGYGTYITKDDDMYRAFWDKDCISPNLNVHIRYGNKAEFCGALDSSGAMSGRGTYVFPDRSKLTATWINNEPERDYEYKDPLSYDWLGTLSVYKPEVVLSPENRIWDEKLVL